MIATALSSAKNYYADHFPYEVPQRMVQGFVASAVIHLTVGHTVRVSLVVGALAATATLIEAVVRPIMLAIFLTSSDYTTPLWTASYLVNTLGFCLPLTQLIVKLVPHNYRTTTDLCLYAGIMFYTALWGCLNNNYKRNIGITCIF